MPIERRRTPTGVVDVYIPEPTDIDYSDDYLSNGATYQYPAPALPIMSPQQFVEGITSMSEEGQAERAALAKAGLATLPVMGSEYSGTYDSPDTRVGWMDAMRHYASLEDMQNAKSAGAFLSAANSYLAPGMTVASPLLGWRFLDIVRGLMNFGWRGRDGYSRIMEPAPKPVGEVRAWDPNSWLSNYLEGNSSMPPFTTTPLPANPPAIPAPTPLRVRLPYPEPAGGVISIPEIASSVRTSVQPQTAARTIGRRVTRYPRRDLMSPEEAEAVFRAERLFGDSL